MSVMYSYAIILFTLTIHERIKKNTYNQNKCLKRSKSEICLDHDIDLNINKKNILYKQIIIYLYFFTLYFKKT